MLPAIKGFVAGVPYTERAGEIICELKASDDESMLNITAIVSLLWSEHENINMKCEQIAEILGCYVIPNRCSECGGGTFLRKLSVYESRERIVDMLHCQGCDHSYRINSDLSCEGLDPSHKVRIWMLDGMRQFKSLEDLSSGSHHFLEGSTCSGAR